MEITQELVRYLEELGRIRLSEEDEARTQKDLSDILGYIDKLNELDTEGVEPLSHAFGRNNVVREDKITNEANVELVLSNAPESKDGSILVPRTFD